MLMNELNVRNHQDWEEICKDLAQYMMLKNYNINTTFENYGRNGEKQYGVDLIPSTNTSPTVVCQCKDVKKLNLAHIKAELNKTDNYLNNIDVYVIFTTASKDTSVQDYFQAKNNYHLRPGGEKFYVGIVYWEDLDPFKVLSRQTLEEYFPNVGRRLIQSDNTRIQYQDSLRALKEIIPQFITEKDIHWLESWDFNCGYIRDSDYEPFLTLKEKYDRADLAKHHGAREFLRYDGVLALIDTFVAGERFYDVLKRFHNSAYVYANNQVNEYGTTISEFKSLGYGYVSEIKSAAAELANAYREDILGQSLQ